MSYQLTVIYDDRMPVPAEIKAIIGANRFAQILRRRVALGEDIRREVAQGGCDDFFHLIDDGDAHFLTNLIETASGERIYLRLPSCLMPTKTGQLAQLVAQCAYAPGPMLLAPLHDGEAPCLLPAADMLALLRPYDQLLVRDFFLSPEFADSTAVDQCGFVNLAVPEQFLLYMADATETRKFNTTQWDRHSIRKASHDREKMRREYSFFHVVPDNLKPFLIPTYGFEDDGKLASYAMERLAIPDVALQLIHSAIDKKSFSVLVGRFFDFITARPQRPDGLNAVRALATQSILDKMRQRLDSFLQTDPGKQLDRLLSAAGPLKGLSEITARAERLIAATILRDGSQNAVIGHGDPCLSNILFDSHTGIMRLIDPKGAVSLEEAWMHPLYDLAKFSHSILGGYDYVNNDLFDCFVNADLNLELSLMDGGAPPSLKAIFNEALKKHGFDLWIVRVYELSLFLSMLPLHGDHPRKLLGFALIASDLVVELERKM